MHAWTRAATRAAPTPPENICGEKKTAISNVSAHLGEVQKGGIPPSAPFGPGPFREKGLAPPAQGRPPWHIESLFLAGCGTE